jgi:hypothetical protein
MRALFDGRSGEAACPVAKRPSPVLRPFLLFAPTAVADEGPVRDNISPQLLMK